ncbi:hypothetical protein BKA62DRAFT_629920 [Auriculariales sp. MPI-PUGE-AT-0066]|nr:hypothetical protein BKA62DRAFT_629920 [Auriculariales sp. MPI-PUGE-AT-0066]
MQNHLLHNRHLPPDPPFFAHTDPAGGWRVLDHIIFMNICSSAWEAVGLVGTKEQFRIGGMTTLLLKGVHPTIVVQQGHWSLAAFMRYMREVCRLILQAVLQV